MPACSQCEMVLLRTMWWPMFSLVQGMAKAHSTATTVTQTPSITRGLGMRISLPVTPWLRGGVIRPMSRSGRPGSRVTPVERVRDDAMPTGETPR